MFGRSRRGAPALRALAMVLGSAAALAPAAAQEAGEADGGTVLDEVVVTSPTGSGAGTGWLGAPDSVYSTPAATGVISREAIERLPARNASDLIQDVPGVYVQTARQDPGLSPNIRGLQDFGRVSVALDGARQNFQQSGHGANGAAYIDSALVREVAIDKGPVSTAGGAGVIGGVVAFRTLEAEDLIADDATRGARLDATAGTNAYDFTGSAAAAARVGEHLDFVGALSRRSLGEYEPGAQGEFLYLDGTDALRFTGQDAWSGLLKARMHPDESQSLKLSWVGSDNTFNTGEDGLTNENRVRAGTLAAAYETDPESAFLDLSANLWRASTENDQFRPARATYGAYDVSYATATVGGDVTNVARTALGPVGVELTQGFEFFLDRGETEAIAFGDDPGYRLSGPTPGGDRDVLSGFAEAKLSYGAFDLIAGLRYDSFALKGDTAVPDGEGGFSSRSASLSDHALLPRLTLAWTPIEGVQLYASRAEGFRPPTTSEALMFGEHIGGGVLFIPNPDLRPERAVTYEAGLNLVADALVSEEDALRAKLAVFSNRVEDFIGQRSSGFRGVIYDNVDEARFRGVEAEISYDTGRLFIGAAYTLIESEFSDMLVPDGAGGLAFTPPRERIGVSGGARFLEEALVLGARVQHVSGRDAPIGFGDAWQPYTRTDLFASYAPTPDVLVRASVENLFDVAYVDPVGNPLYPAPGRTATLGLTLKF